MSEFYGYNKYSDYLKNKYGEKVYKLPVNLPLTCPNRDGTIGTCGCIFCAEEGAGFDLLSNKLSITEQIEKNAEYIGKNYGSRKFIAYFQNYCNTYMPLSTFKEMLYAVDMENVVAVAISTRPDLITTDYLEASKKYCEETGRDICFEIGLQTVNYKTLKIINRGHGLGEFVRAARLIKDYGFELCVHMILNLPWDDDDDVVEGSKLLSALSVDCVKLHSLYIMENAPIAEMYKKGEIKLIDKNAYIKRVALFIKHLSPHIVIERLVSRAPREGSLFVNWGSSSFKVINEINEYLVLNKIKQGEECFLNRPINIQK